MFCKISKKNSIFLLETHVWTGKTPLLRCVLHRLVMEVWHNGSIPLGRFLADDTDKTLQSSAKFSSPGSLLGCDRLRLVIDRQHVIGSCLTLVLDERLVEVVHARLT